MEFNPDPFSTVQIEEVPPPVGQTDAITIREITKDNAHLVANQLIHSRTLAAKALLDELTWQLEEAFNPTPKGIS